MAQGLTLDRRHSFAGRNNLTWFFANRKWVRGLQVVECAWSRRALPEGEAGIRFLILAAKRSHKLAHDRNKIKRWLRAAITETPVFGELEAAAIARGEQILILLRISKPVREVHYSDILLEAEKIVQQVKKRL